MARSKFRMFFSASGKLGVGSVIFAIVFLSVGIFEHYKEKNITSFSFVLLAFICLGWGSYLAWSAEYDKLEKEIEKNSKPHFTVDISEFVRNAGDLGSAGSTFFANISVVNTSISESSIRSVYIQTPVENGKFKASPFGFRDLVRHKVVPTPYGIEGRMTRPVTDRIEDVLQRLILEPSIKGFHKQGWLEFPKVPFADKLQGFDLYVEDAYGDTHGPFRNLPEMEVGYVGNQRQTI
jgi:hypothetical protein